MNHREIVLKHLNPIFNKYNTNPEELTSDWTFVSNDRKKALALCIVDCMKCGYVSVKEFFLTYSNQPHLNTRLEKIPKYVSWKS